MKSSHSVAKIISSMLSLWQSLIGKFQCNAQGSTINIEKPDHGTLNVYMTIDTHQEMDYCLNHHIIS